MDGEQFCPDTVEIASLGSTEMFVVGEMIPGCESKLSTLSSCESQDREIHSST